ncbi:hypothetical protein SAY86_012974 [Trapa natans]|uniref:Uncharacterized protein n=1 Tax=Trapa natans TaxID=22666 RepID=A0AAN7MDR4_TRANT|nr:hypothetical protein SAY86_012974 [Trapa natans]
MPTATDPARLIPFMNPALVPAGVGASEGGEEIEVGVEAGGWTGEGGDGGEVVVLGEGAEAGGVMIGEGEEAGGLAAGAGVGEAALGEKAGDGDFGGELSGEGAGDCAAEKLTADSRAIARRSSPLPEIAIVVSPGSCSARPK